MKVTMLSNFELPAKGISPYADQLANELIKLGIHLKKIDYSAAYPNLLAPHQPERSKADSKLIHYLRPDSWKRFCETSEDIVHIQYWTQFSSYYLLYIVRRLKSLGKTSIITVHNPKPHEKIPVLGKLQMLLLKEATHLIVHTESGRKELLKSLGIEGNKVSVIPHGNDIYYQSPAEVIKNFENKKKQIIFAGNIRPYKGTDLLIKAWKEIHTHHSDYTLIIAGRLWGRKKSVINIIIGNILNTKKFANEIESSLINHEHFNIKPIIKFLDEELLNHLIGTSQLCVLPYRKFSGQSGIAAKASALGTPIICSNHDGLSQTVIDKNYVIKDLTVEGLSKFLSNKIKTLNEETSLKQWEKSKLSTWNQSALLHLNVYKTILSDCIEKNNEK